MDRENSPEDSQRLARAEKEGGGWSCRWRKLHGLGGRKGEPFPRAADTEMGQTGGPFNAVPRSSELPI